MQFETAPQFATLRAFYGRVEDWLAQPAADLERIAEGVSGWSALEHLAHIALANELTFRNVANLVNEKGALIVAEGEPSEDARAVLTAGSLPRGHAEAPRMVRPPRPVQRELLEQWIGDNLRDLDAMEEREDRIAGAPGFIPHQLLGPLSALAWLRFGAVHTLHHAAIIDDVLAD